MDSVEKGEGGAREAFPAPTWTGTRLTSWPIRRPFRCGSEGAGLAGMAGSTVLAAGRIAICAGLTAAAVGECLSEVASRSDTQQILQHICQTLDGPVMGHEMGDEIRGVLHGP